MIDRAMTEREEAFLWGIFAAIGYMAVQRLAQVTSAWVIDQCANPRFSLTTLRRIHQKDQEEASQHAE